MGIQIVSLFLKNEADELHITYLQDKAKALLSWLESEEVRNPEHPDHEKRVYRVWDLARDIEKDTREYRETLDEPDIDDSIEDAFIEIDPPFNPHE